MSDMSELVIVFALLAVGKIHGQGAVAAVPPVLYVRPSTVPVYSNRPVSVQEYIGTRTAPPPTRLYTNPPRPADRNPDFTQKVEASGNLNLLLSTVRENQPKRKLFVSSKLPDKMNRPLDENDPLNNTINKKEYLSNDVYEDFNLDKNRTSENAVKPFQPYTPQSENVSAVKPVNVDKNYMLDIAILPKVSLDERSSFNGDQCPEGYAKVNGQCVKAD
ncbi:unnamed protein product [Spodoptera exigua]|uniref:Uncharacterized protein n=1 Tax=Spodoptera exigua TaxID=7107 RepID=A0A922MQ85_SPOEX|nr:hypothetical protein HF086_002232 [Spodoptera exigua]CAH0669280.1 unnamed protein product [Spodoptera exigua]